MTRLALTEMWRTRGRYGAVVVALSLIVFLVLILAALADGLFAGSTDALATSDADVQVFSDASRDSLVRSQLDPGLRADVAEVDGVTDVGELSVLLGGAEGPEGDLDVALVGFRPGHVGAPTEVLDGDLPVAGEDGVAAVDETLLDEGVAIGDQVTFSGSEAPLEVIGVVTGTRFQLQPTVWVPTDQLRAIREETRPETGAAPEAVGGLPVGVDDDADPEEVAAAITRAVGGVRAVTTDEAVLAIPGVAQQAIVLQAVIVTTYGVAALVIALFFALITLEKRTLLAMLKALGGSTRGLGGGLVVQAVVAAFAALVVGGALTAATIAVIPAGVPVQLEPATIATVVPATVVTAVAGAALSFRRVGRVEPAAALGGTL